MPMPSPRWRLSSRLRPTSLLDYWTIAAFVAAVLGLMRLRGVDFGTLILFLAPPTAALFWRQHSTRQSTRVLCVLFLSLIDVGVALADVEALLPNLGGVDRALSPTHDRILTWYVLVYLLFLTLALPLVLFARGLLDHHSGRPAQFSKPTCVLGLFACLVVGPSMMAVSAATLGLSPVWGTRQAPAPASARPDGAQPGPPAE